jgi:PilZ domain
MSEATGPADNVVRLIVGGLEGTLSTPAGAQVPVRVFERDQEMLAVLLSVPAEELGTEPMVLEYSSPHGLVRFRGRPSIERPDLLRFRLSELPEVVQRREFVRVGAAQPIVLIAEDDGSVLAGHAIEVSGGGMLINTPDALRVESVVQFTLHLGDGAGPITGQGRIVRVEAGGRRAIAFEDISSSDRQRLIRFIFERQRALLAKGARVAPLNRQHHRTEG